MTRPEFIASDIHLGAVPVETERAFVRFLEYTGAEATSLLLNGDLFDFWFEYRTVIPARHIRVLGALAALVDAGIPVTLVGGNHDAWGGRFLREELGLTFQERPFHTTIAGRPAFVAHGDGLGAGDLRYRVLKGVLRAPFTISIFRLLHPDIGMRIARAVSRTEAREVDAGMRGRAQFLHDWAVARLAEDPRLHYVVCGHAHIPEVTDVGGGRYYLNAGDWLNHFTYIRVDPDGVPSLRTFDQAARP